MLNPWLEPMHGMTWVLGNIPQYLGNWMCVGGCFCTSTLTTYGLKEILFLSVFDLLSVVGIWSTPVKPVKTFPPTITFAVCMNPKVSSTQWSWVIKILGLYHIFAADLKIPIFYVLPKCTTDANHDKYTIWNIKVTNLLCKPAYWFYREKKNKLQGVAKTR